MSKTVIDNFPPDQLTLTDVLSRRTAYGLIWKGRYRHQPCVVKMIMLTTGVHYDKDLDQYQTAEGHQLSESETEAIFGHNDHKPFYHTEFRHRRAMTPDAFFHELDNLVELSDKGIAPTVYGCGLNRTHRIHYAFIVMERVDTCLKDLSLHRTLSTTETQLIFGAIEQLHYVHGLLHGDLQLGNIGVYLDTDHQIKRVCFFDCQKISHRDQYRPTEFERLSESETGSIKRHLQVRKK
jgi:hypothetical protein